MRNLQDVFKINLTMFLFLFYHIVDKSAIAVNDEKKANIVTVCNNFIRDLLIMQVNPDKCLSITLRNINLRTERTSSNVQCVARILARRLMLKITLKTSIFLGVLRMIASIAAPLLIEGTSCINM